MTTSPQARPADTEVELKLALRPADVAAFKAMMARRRPAPTVQKMWTRYFDTPDFSLSDSGVAVRLRRVGRRWLQTLKIEGTRSGGLSARGEYECALARAALDFSRFPGEAIARIPPSLLRELRPMFETRFTRTAWLIRSRGGACIEVALDVGSVIAGRRSQPLCEVEMELKSGQADALFALALSLGERVTLMPLDLGKAERGNRLARGIVPAPQHALPIALLHEMTAEDGFVAICHACLRQFQANLPGLLADDDPEYLHQARVALRRLRAALRLFKPLCPLPPEMRAGLRVWDEALGSARDWDVLGLQTLPAIAPYFADQTAWRHFAEAVQAQRSAVRQAMRQAIGASRPDRQLLPLQRWLLQKAWRTPPRQTLASRPRTDPAARSAQCQPLADFAAQALKKGRRKLRKMARDFARLEPTARHRLRIRIKRQRYAAEFFKPLQLKGNGKRYRQALVIAQEALGRANDAHVANLFLATLAEHKEVAGFVAGWLAHAAQQAPDAAFVRALKKLQ